MKCITVCQPWAWALIYGPKRIEYRTWNTHYRGPLLIHAGRSRSWMCATLNDRTAVPFDQLVFGAIIGVCDLYACPHQSELPRLHPSLVRDPFSYCWLTRNPRPFAEPIPYTGRLGLYEVPDDIVSEPLAHLGCTDRYTRK